MTRFFLPIYRNVCLGLVSSVFLASAASAQNVSVIGPITPGDCAQFSSTTILKDAGISCPGSGGTLTIPGIIINPTPASTNLGFVVTQTGVGGSSGFTGVNGSGFAYDLINIPSDKIQQTVVSPLTYGLQVYMQPDTGSKGQKIALGANINRIGAAGDTGRDTIAASFFAQSFVPNNGTNTGAGANGTLFGENALATANSGATNLFMVSGAEVDVGILTGASSRYRMGWSVVDNGNLQAADPVYDAAYEIGAFSGTTAPGWKNGLLFSNLHGAAPFSTGACAICTDGSAVTIAKGIDFSSYTISGSLLKGPNSYSVSGLGDTATRHIIGSTSVPVQSGSACPGFTLNTGSTDLAGRVSFTSATSCAIQFGTAFTNLPFCVASPNAANSTIAVSASQTVLTITFGTAQTVASYICMGT